MSDLMYYILGNLINNFKWIVGILVIAVILNTI